MAKAFLNNPLRAFLSFDWSFINHTVKCHMHPYSMHNNPVHIVSIAFCMFTSPPLCAEFPPPPVVRVTPRYVVLNTSADLVLEARFRGNFYVHDWVYNEDDPTFLTGLSSLFTPATVTNVGQTYTIPAGSASLRVGYYGPRINPTLTGTAIRATPENTVIVGSFGKCTTDNVAPQVKTLSGTHL